MATINGDNNNNTLNGIVESPSDLDDFMYGFGGNDTFRPQGTAYTYADGGDGNDTFWGRANTNDYFVGGTGNDTFLDTSGFGSYNTYIGGSGDDVYHYREAASNSVVEQLNAGNDVVYSYVISLYLPANIEILYLMLSAYHAIGNNLANTMYGNSNTDCTIEGHGGNDTLIGKSKNDTLLGGADNDTLKGDGGKDMLNGGTGADTFTYSSSSQSQVGANRDIIQDFNRVAGDKIDLSAIDADLTLAGDQAFTLGSYVNGILTGDVIGGADVQIELTGAPALNLSLDIIL